MRPRNSVQIETVSSKTARWYWRLCLQEAERGLAL